MARIHYVLAAATLFMATAVANADDDTRTIMLLHTNDIHAHLRPNDSGDGGLPYISAHVKQVRSARDDVLLLDAGDVLEKGNMISWLTRGKIMYEALNQIGYDAGVPGNHDFAFSPEQLKINRRTAHFSLVCANATASGALFKPSTIITVNGVRIGIIGLTVFGSTTEKAVILARETKRLLPDTDLQIALCHQSSKVCRALADAVPEIDVFVSGHSHEVLRQPIIAVKSGAMIVQAGSLARFVGQWELVVDLQAKKIVHYKGQLVPLPHATSACDKDMVAWILQREAEICPQASKVVGNAAHKIGGVKLATLFARALLHATNANVALSHTSVLRGQIYPGPIEIDDLFATCVPGPQRKPLEVRLSGAQLQRILHAAGRNKGDMVLELKKPEEELQDARSYRVVLIQGLWNILQHDTKLGLANADTNMLDVDLIDASADYLQQHGSP